MGLIGSHPALHKRGESLKCFRLGEGRFRQSENGIALPVEDQMGFQLGQSLNACKRDASFDMLTLDGESLSIAGDMQRLCVMKKGFADAAPPSSFEQHTESHQPNQTTRDRERDVFQNARLDRIDVPEHEPSQSRRNRESANARQDGHDSETETIRNIPNQDFQIGQGWREADIDDALRRVLY
nr:hypothetical protein [Microvirga solisilvae]